MKRLLVSVLFVAALAAGAMSPGAAGAEPENSIDLGIGGGLQLMPHCKGGVLIAEYEHMLGPKLAFLGRGSGVHYKFDDGTYVENGRPKGIDVGVRYYLSGGMKGFYFGGALGYWVNDWTFTDNQGQPSETQGKAENKSVRADLDFGVRIPVGSSSVSILPSVHVGKYFASSTCEYTAPASLAGTSCSQDSEVNFYGFLALTVGVAF